MRRMRRTPKLVWVVGQSKAEPLRAAARRFAAWGGGAAMRRLLLLVSLGSSGAQYGCETHVGMDLSEVTNPAIALDWTNALGVDDMNQRAASGTTAVALGATDQGGAPFPGGSMRPRNAATGVNNGGQALDLLI
eukprot:4174903-Prymnesium_polylepis.1